MPRKSIVKVIEKQMGALDLMVQAIESYAAEMHGLKVRRRQSETTPAELHAGCSPLGVL